MTRKHKLALAGILCLAFALRVAGVRCGLPSETRRLATFHPDESITFYSLERMHPGRLDFYPGDSLYWGTFLVYSEAAVAKLMQVSGIVSIGGRDFMLSHLREADKLYISGRLLVAFFGTAAVLVFFLAARKLFGAGTALFSAFLFASFSVDAWISSVFKPDSIMLFWGLLAFYFSLRITERGEGSAKNFLLAGAFTGLSAVSKYNGIVFALPVVLAWFFSLKKKEDAVKSFPLLLASGAAAAAVFVAVDPYVVLRFHDAWGYMSAVAAKGAFPAAPLSGYAGYLFYTLPLASGWPLLLFSLPGFVLLARRRSAAAWIAVIFPACYFLRFGASGSQAITYCLPLTPFIALAGGASAEALSSRGWGKVLAALVAGYTLAYAGYLQSFFIAESTYTQADAWIEANIKPGTAVAISKNDSWIPPVIRQYAPPDRVLEGGSSQGPLTEAIAGLPGAAEKADYVVLSEVEYYQAWEDAGRGEPATGAILAGLGNSFEEVKRFEKPLSRFFIPQYRKAEACSLRFMRPTLIILHKKAR
ncbi:MAG: ArnT family glycosyltransferase, partial [Burkholderiales bacterium]